MLPGESGYRKWMSVSSNVFAVTFGSSPCNRKLLRQVTRRSVFETGNINHFEN